MKQPILTILSFTLCIGHSVQAQKTKVEKVKPICEGLAFAKKPIAAVAPFKMATNMNAGTGLSDMMMNALLNTGCFRVVERDRLNVIMEEQGLGLSGAGDESSFASVGKQIGAQLIIMGTITEFSENESGGGVVGGGLLKRALPVVGGAGMKKAHLGFTIRLVNPSTGEVLAMQSFDKKRNSVGVAGGGLFGSVVGGGGFYKSKAMQDAVEEGLIDAVEFISAKRQDFMDATQSGSGGSADAEKISKEDCATLKLSRRPKIMVIIPEDHLVGVGSKYEPNRANTVNVNINNNNNPSPNVNSIRLADPAGEIEITRKFLEYGYELVDSKQFEKLRGDEQFLNAFENPQAASKLANKFGADIIIVGKAFSEYSKGLNNMSSCRARVEAKAIIANNASIVAANGLEGSGLDVSEAIAGKTALKNAGTKIADYFLTQLCKRTDDIASSYGAKGGGTTAVSGNETVIKLSNIDFSKASSVLKMLQSIKIVSKAERTSFSDNVAVFNVQHTASTDDLVEKLLASSKTSGLKLDVSDISNGKANLTVK